MKYFLSVIILVFSINISFGQFVYEQSAKQAFINYEFSQAADLYRKALVKEKSAENKNRIMYQIGMCYFNIADYKQAENWFTKAVQGNTKEDLAQLYLALAMKANEKYAEAIPEFLKYTNDDRGEKGAKSCELAQQWKDKPSRFIVSNEQLLNSAESDFSPVYSDKKSTEMYFTSTRLNAMGSELDKITGSNRSDIYFTKKDKKGKWSSPLPLGEAINTDFNEGSAFVNNKANRMFLTRCEVQKNKSMGTKILVAERRGLGWDVPTPIAIDMNDTLIYGHPALNKEETKLYFVSNMQGGIGGKDIYVVDYDKKTKKMGTPRNLGGEINTSSDELFPFVNDDGTLYFSSNGHLGMGGMDIFKAKKVGEDFTEVENMKYPINSSADDFGIVFEGLKERGFFSSNREGGKGSDDIYSFILPQLLHIAQGVVRDEDTKAPIINAKVKLIGSDGSSVEISTDAAGGYKYAENGAERYIQNSTTYTIYASADKYLNSVKIKFTTIGLDESKTFENDFYLKTTLKPIELPNIFYDLGKWDLRPESMLSLDKLVNTLNENPNITIKLGSHTDSRDNDERNIVLSQKRAQSVVDYLISKGIESERMEAVGYGETKPKSLDNALTTKMSYVIPSNTLLTEAFILSIKNKADQEEAFQLNRRTDFEVLSTTFVSKKILPPVPKVEDDEEDEIEKANE